MANKGPLYNNSEYTALITSLFSDLFYLPGQSYGTRLFLIRKYTEIIIRRLLNYPCNKNLTIGNEYTIQKLDKRGFTEPLFRESLKKILGTGNDNSHTEVRTIATEEEYQEILESLFNLYGYLFYKHFKKWSFGSNKDKVSAFSCLPPIIRHITLTALYEDDPSNLIVLEKLALAKLKAYDKETALTWVEERKEALLGMSVPVDSGFVLKLIPEVGVEAAVSIAATMSDNYYNVLKEKIQKIDDGLGSKPLYSDFESAKSYYEEHGIVSGTSQDVIEFNDLMEFVYIGRRKNEEEISAIPEENYIISQIVVIPPELWELGNN